MLKPRKCHRRMQCFTIPIVHVIVYKIMLVYIIYGMPYFIAKTQMVFDASSGNSTDGWIDGSKSISPLSLKRSTKMANITISRLSQMHKNGNDIAVNVVECTRKSLGLYTTQKINISQGKFYIKRMKTQYYFIVRDLT